MTKINTDHRQEVIEVASSYSRRMSISAYTPMHATYATPTASVVSSELRDGSCGRANRRTDALITRAVSGWSVTAIDRSPRKAYVEPAETSLTAGGQGLRVNPHRIGRRQGTK